MDTSGPTELDFTIYVNGALPGMGPQPDIPALRSHHYYYCKICKADFQGGWDSICKARGLTRRRGWITDSCYYGNYRSDLRNVYAALRNSAARPSVRRNCKAGVIIPGQRAFRCPQTPQLGLWSQHGCTMPCSNHQQGHCGNRSSQTGRKVLEREGVSL